MKILVIDACGSFCGVCVWQDGQMLSHAFEKMERGQDTRLMPMILAVMAEASTDFSSLDKIAATKGPGSFTSTRVGLATARGIGIASGKPVIGIDRFSLSKAMQNDQRDLLIVIQSKRVELFCQFFPSKGAAYEACMMTQQEIEKFLTTRAGTEIIHDEKMDEEGALNACARLAAAADVSNSAYKPVPLYLRPPDAIPSYDNA